MKLYGLIGFPLDHSFSKKYFTEKFKLQGIEDCRYDLFPLTDLDELPALLNQNPNLVGLNVTIPYKKTVIKYLQQSFIPAEISACNCIKIMEGNLAGYNTDITGFERSLLSHVKDRNIQALILGNGGAAEAVKFVLHKMGIHFKIVSRNGNDDLTYKEFNKKIIQESLLIINTTPVGTFPEIDSCPDIPYQFLTAQHILFDLIYNPAKTLFLKKGEEKGATIINGSEMLIIQAEESWKIWNS